MEPETMIRSENKITVYLSFFNTSTPVRVSSFREVARHSRYSRRSQVTESTSHSDDTSSRRRSNQLVFFCLPYSGLPEPCASHSGLAQPYASEHARLWLHWPRHPFIGHQLPYMVKQRSTSQKYNHPLASSNSALFKRSGKVPKFYSGE